MTDITARKIEKKISLPIYSIGEETINTLSHGIGAGMGIAALILCMLKTNLENGYAVASSIIFGASLIMLYSMSAIYHCVTPGIAKRVLRVIDHCTIYILIAGTYTPFTLLVLRNTVGWPLFIGIWLAAILGVVLNAIDVEKFKVLSMICYLVMGWSIVFTFSSLLNGLDMEGIKLLLWGGIAYTIGAVIYGIGSKVRYMHSIWHFFVLAGSILHFFCIYLYVL